MHRMRVDVQDGALRNHLEMDPDAGTFLIELGWRVYTLFNDMKHSTVSETVRSAHDDVERRYSELNDKITKTVESGMESLQREIREMNHVTTRELNLNSSTHIDQLSNSFGAASHMMKNAFEAAHAKVTNLVTVDTMDRLMRLEQDIRSKDEEIASKEADIRAKDLKIARLNCSNAVKGAVGERDVMEWLRDSGDFCSFEFKPTSSICAASDFHVINPATGEFIAVEVKNKDDVRAADVAKSNRDIMDMHERFPRQFVGYAFVSIRSANIPGKGSVVMDFADGSSVPTLWWGASSSASCDDSKHELRTLFRALWSVARNFAPLRDQRIEQDELAHKIVHAVERLGKCKDALHSLQQGLHAVKKHADFIESECSGVLSYLVRYMADSGIKKCVDEPDQTCTKCTRSFKTPAGLQRHKCK